MLVDFRYLVFFIVVQHVCYMASSLARAARKIVEASKKASKPNLNLVDLSTIETYVPVALDAAYDELTSRLTRAATKVFNEEIAKRYPEIAGKFACWVYISDGKPVLACAVKRRYTDIADDIMDTIEDALLEIGQDTSISDKIVELTLD